MSEVTTTTNDARTAKQIARSLRPGPKRQSFAEAKAATFAQYDGTFRALANLPNEEPAPKK